MVRNLKKKPFIKPDVISVGYLTRLLLDNIMDEFYLQTLYDVTKLPSDII